MPWKHLVSLHFFALRTVTGGFTDYRHGYPSLLYERLKYGSVLFTNSWDAVTQPEAGIEHHTTRIIRYEFENAVRGKDYFFILRLDCGPRLIFRVINCRKVVCASVVAKHASELAPWFNKFVQFKQ